MAGAGEVEDIEEEAEEEGGTVDAEAERSTPESKRGKRIRTTTACSQVSQARTRQGAVTSTEAALAPAENRQPQTRQLGEAPNENPRTAGLVAPQTSSTWYRSAE